MMVRSAVVSRASRGAALAAALAAALGASAVLAGCGTTTPASTTQAAQTPVPTAAAGRTHAPASECSAVWVEGHKLPQAYPGCLRNGHLIAAQRHSCSSGQVLVTYSGAFYAVTGGPVNRVPGLAHTKLYKKMMRACNG